MRKFNNMSNKLPAIIEIENKEEIISFQGIFEPPTLKCDNDIIRYMSLSTWTRSQMSWSNPKIYFLDFYTENSKWINEWMKETSEFIVGNSTNPISYKRNINVHCYHQVNNKCEIQKWKLFGAFIQSSNLNVIHDLNKPNFVFPKCFFDKLTRKTLIEKKNNPMIQTLTEIEFIIDNAKLMS